MSVYVRDYFEVSSIILTIFRRRGGGGGGGGGNLPPHPSTTSKRTPKKPINIRVNQDFPLSRRATDEKLEITLSGLYRDCFYINNFEQILKFCGPVPQCIFVSSCHYRLKIL